MKKGQFKVSVIFILIMLLIPIVFAGDSEKRVMKVAETNNEFSFNFLKEILKTDEGANVFISPLSVSFALSMVLNGADGTTKEQMMDTLQLKGIELIDLNTGMKDLNKSLYRADRKVELRIANSLWLREGTTFKKDFLKLNKKYYDAEIQVLNFYDKSASDTINKWVKKATNKKIKEIVPKKIDSLTIAYIINAIYFKGSWTDEFDPDDTKEESFYLLNNKSKTHPLMYQQSEYKYFESNDMQCISLPYGKGRISMYVFLPSEEVGIIKFLKEIDYKKYQTWTNQTRKEKVKLKLPKFKMEYEKNLKKILSDLGMPIAFDIDNANFGKMCNIPPNVYIRKVKHKTFVEVNEEGTEAAAVTSISMGIKSAAPKQIYEMYINRPFFFTIHDNETGVVIFMGVITNPEEEGKFFFQLQPS